MTKWRSLLSQAAAESWLGRGIDHALLGSRAIRPFEIGQKWAASLERLGDVCLGLLCRTAFAILSVAVLYFSTLLAAVIAAIPLEESLGLPWLLSQGCTWYLLSFTLAAFAGIAASKLRRRWFAWAPAVGILQIVAFPFVLSPYPEDLSSPFAQVARLASPALFALLLTLGEARRRPRSVGQTPNGR